MDEAPVRVDLEGLIPIVMGVYLYLVATRRIGEKKGDPRYEHWISSFGGPMRIGSPIILLFGLLKFFRLF